MIGRWLAALAVTTFAATMLLLPPIRQPQSYHDFADQRRLVPAIPHTLNVVSNAGFLIAAMAGFAVCSRGRFRKPHERTAAIAFFIGILLTAIGSTIYHLNPSDATLPYDRAGMTVGFMAFLAMLIHERMDAGSWLLPASLAVGLGSIAWWVRFGDLRPYGWVQFFPIVALIVLIAFAAPAYPREKTALSIVFASYGAAKVFELADRPIYELTQHVISGHTLKHLAAAVAPLAIASWIATSHRPVDSLEPRPDHAAG